MKRPLILALISLILGICTNYFSVENELIYIGGICIIMIIFILLYICCKPRCISVILPVFFIIGLGIFQNSYVENVAFDAMLKKDICVNINGCIMSKDLTESGYNYKLDVKSYAIENNPHQIIPVSPVNLRWYCQDDLNIGSIINATGYIHNFSTPKNPSDFNSFKYFTVRGYNYRFYHTVYKVNYIDYSIFSYLDNVKLKMLENFDRCLPQELSALLKSVILGDKSQLSAEVKDSYREIGIYHFLAISGLHISVLATLIFSLLKRINYYMAGVVLALFLGAYGCITGFGVSIIRASIMFSFYILSVPLNKRYDMLSSACATAIIILMFQPLYIMDSSFQYSFGAIFGIGLTADAFRYWKTSCKGFLSAVGAGIATKPISYYYTYKINTIDIFVNLMLIPLMSLIVVLGFCIAIGCSISLQVGKTIAVFVIPVLKLFEFLCNLIENISFCNFIVGKPYISEIIIICAGIILTYLLLKEKKAVMALGTMLLLVVACVNIHSKASTGFQTDFLYVGQGDCALSRSEDKAILIDTGGNKNSEIGKDVGYYTILPYLEYCGIGRLDGVFISHSDADHLKGILDIMDKVDIENIYVSKQMKNNAYYLTMQEKAKENNIPVISLGNGDKLNIGDMKIDVYSPDINSRYTSNNGSLVFKLCCKDIDILFTGEIDEKIEKQLIERENLRADILKASHHGSRKSNSSELLRAVMPKYFVASAGEGNLYEHPHKECIDRVKEMNIPYGITYEMGMISVTEKDGKPVVKGFCR